MKLPAASLVNQRRDGSASAARRRPLDQGGAAARSCNKCYGDTVAFRAIIAVVRSEGTFLRRLQASVNEQLEMQLANRSRWSPIGTLGCTAMALAATAATAQSVPAADEAGADLSALRQRVEAQTRQLDALKRSLAQQEAALADMRRALGDAALAARRGAGTPGGAAGAADNPPQQMAQVPRSRRSHPGGHGGPRRRPAGTGGLARCGGGADLRAARRAHPARQGRAGAVAAVRLLVEQPRRARRLHHHPGAADRPDRHPRGAPHDAHRRADRPLRHHQPPGAGSQGALRLSHRHQRRARGAAGLVGEQLGVRRLRQGARRRRADRALPAQQRRPEQALLRRQPALQVAHRQGSVRGDDRPSR